MNGPEPVAPDRSLIYKTTDEIELRLHVFEPDRADRERDPLPCILFFFGGGWRAGTPEQFYPHCEYLASRGLVAISAEYRVSWDDPNPFECVADGRSAMRWVRAHAADLGIDPDRVAAGGGSAGGHVAAACATTAIDDQSEDLTVNAQPDALVLFNPVFDNGRGGFGHETMRGRWREISPLHNIGVGHPPTAVFLGGDDGLMPVAAAQTYGERMAAVGAPYELFVYPGQPHGFFNYRDGANLHYYSALSEADRFLASLGFTHGPPTIAESPVEVTRS